MNDLTKDLPKGSPFWQFSLRTYGQEGVPPACIVLQDEAGVDVNIMLYCLWLATQGRGLSANDVRAIDGAMAAWRAQVVVPLRNVRRALREPPAAFAKAASEELRTRIKRVELESERLQQEALYGLKPASEWGAPADPAVAMRQNMQAYAEELDAAFQPAAMDAILRGAASAAGLPGD